MKRTILFLTILTLSINSVFSAGIELPQCISSGMVLQRDVPMQLWGWANGSGKVRATLVREGVEYTNEVEVDAQGKWLMSLPQQAACSTPCQLTFTMHDADTIVLSDILIGDVWLAGGQSNMEKKVSHLLDAEEVLAQAEGITQIRAFRSSYQGSVTPLEKISVGQGWFVCEGENRLQQTSAVAYVFALNVFQKTGVPIGLLQAYKGGTEAETWLSQGIINSEPELKSVSESLAHADPEGEKLYKNYPSINFNGQINPLIHYPLKGMIFYQGESNTKRALEYSTIMKYLIKDWRTQWNDMDLPFYYVQLFNIGTAKSEETLYEENNWSDLREQQLQLLDKGVDKVWMAVSIDTNEDPRHPKDMIRIHPKNKKPIGERLALLALRNTYNVDTLASSPMYSHSYTKRRRLYVVMKHVGEGLSTRDDMPLNGFVIAEGDGTFVKAEARIINDNTIELRHPNIKHPSAARYAWARNPDCNLINSASLPASPFRTDTRVSGYEY